MEVLAEDGIADCHARYKPRAVPGPSRLLPMSSSAAASAATGSSSSRLPLVPPPGTPALAGAAVLSGLPLARTTSPSSPSLPVFDGAALADRSVTAMLLGHCPEHRRRKTLLEALAADAALAATSARAQEPSGSPSPVATDDEVTRSPLRKGPIPRLAA
mgnify:CR=1 FL=1